MVTLEQVKLLESKVIKAVDCIRQLTEENSLLKGKLSGYEKRINELEALIQRFKEDQGRIEKGIVSALEKLDQFEDAIDSALAGSGDSARAGPKPRPPAQKPVPARAEKPADAAPDNVDASESIMPDLEDEDDSGAEDGEDQEKPGELDIF